MSMQTGRDAYAASRTPPRARPLDAAAIRRSGILRGRALYASARGDREARAVVELLLAEDAG